jgi:hypothetical protein
VRIAFRQGQAPKRGPWLPPGTTIATPGVPQLPPFIASQEPGRDPTEDRVGLTESKENKRSQPVY